MLSFLPALISAAAYSPSVDCQALHEKMAASHIPAVAVAVFYGRKVRTMYYSLEGELLSPDSVFEAASLSKPVFAAGVLKLVQEGRLDLDSPLSNYLQGPYKHQQDPFGNEAGTAIDVVEDPRLGKVTARMVLTHSSGLPNWSRSGALTFRSEPGAQWSYSGEGYVYLQHVVETITRESIADFLRNTVLRPLGMTHSGFVWEQAFAASVVAGHTASGAVMPVKRYRRAVVSTTLYTTLGDYSRFVEHLLTPEQGSVFALEEQAQFSVRPDLDLAWGLGLAVAQTPLKEVFHWGANPGFQSFFLCQPTASRGVLFLTNSDNGLDLIDTLVKRVLPGTHPELRFPLLHPVD